MRHLILGGLVTTLALIVIITYFARETASPESVSSPSFPDVSAPTGSEPAQSIIGEKILSLSTTEEWTVGEYLVAAEQNIGGNLYQIFYNSDFDTIGISLENEALGVARRAAEQRLIELTGFSESFLCREDVSVTVPREVSEKFSGQNLGLSFCPGAVAL